jgi:hypothetical protein
MRTVVLAALGLVTITPSIPAQDQPTTWAAKLLKDDKGVIPKGHDFGTVPKGAVLNHRFPITNIYAVPLMVSCDVSCNCVAITPRQQVLQKNETGYIDVAMDTMRFNGQKQVTVTVKVQHYDQRPQFWSDTTLLIQGFCRGDVTLEPAQAVFGAVPIGQAVAREVHIRYQGNHPRWEITGPAADQTAPFDVRHQEMYRNPNRQVGYKVTLTLRADAPPGSHKGDLKLATNDPNNPTIEVPYDVNVQAPLTVLPSDTIRLGAVKVGEVQERKVYVKAGQAFHIVGVDGQGDGVTTEARKDGVPTQILTIKVQPTQPGLVQKTLTIKTDLGGGATTTIKVEATVAP